MPNLPNLKISKSHSVFEILTQIFAFECHFYRGPIPKYQLGVLHHSFIGFVGGGDDYSRGGGGQGKNSRNLEER